MDTTIKISQELKSLLDKMKMHKRETYNDVIEYMAEDNFKLSDKTKKEIENAKKRIERGEFYSQEEVEKMFGLR